MPRQRTLVGAGRGVGLGRRLNPMELQFPLSVVGFPRERMIASLELPEFLVGNVKLLPQSTLALLPFSQ